MFIVKKCSTKGAFEVVSDKKLNFENAKKKFEVIADTPVLLLVKVKDCDISCFKTGKLLIKGCKSKEKAEKIAKEFYSSISHNKLILCYKPV